jgi:mannose-1-phosphate guanylyltransferase
VLTYDTTNSFILAEKDKLVVTYGLDGYLVADSGDVLLICKKDLENEFRTMIKDVRFNKGEKYI